MVWIFSPPGVSSASAKSFRARRSLAALGLPAFELDDAPRQLLVAEHRPFRQAGEDAVRHVGGGGARIGQAEDFRRIGALQQQADDALRQHMRLARTGIGRHPDRILGIGGARLPVRRVAGHCVAPLRHSSLSPGPPADHSRTRARWSYSPSTSRLAERQRPRQVAGLGIAIVEQQLFEPRPGLLRQVAGALQLAVVLEDRLVQHLAIRLQPDEGEVGRLERPDILEGAAPQQRALQRKLRRKQRVRLALGRRRAGLVVEDVGQPFRARYRRGRHSPTA